VVGGRHLLYCSFELLQPNAVKRACIFFNDRLFGKAEMNQVVHLKKNYAPN
jgi:hypothetical protein